ncbi:MULTISPECIES: hypothetical protein [unclassified Marinovum]
MRSLAHIILSSCLLAPVFVAPIVLASSLVVPSRATAAEFSTDPSGTCAVTLTGEIAEGDTARLDEIALDQPASWTLPDDGHWKTICLDSPGGSFAEAMTLGRYLATRQIGTVVEEAATCTDACALAFLFGTAAQGPNRAVTHRRLHIGGTLGFRQPALAEETGSVAQMIDFYALAAMSRPDAARPFLDADLAGAMPASDAPEPFLIDTVNRAGRWDIAVIGFKAPALSDRGFFHACQSLTIWSKGLSTGAVVYEDNAEVFQLSVSSWTAGGALRDRYDLQFASRDLYECAATVAVSDTGAPLPLICGYNEVEDTGIGPDDCNDPDLIYLWAPIPALAMFPADTTLAALADGSALPAEVPELTRPTPCRAEDQSAEVINVNNFTTLRGEPNVESEKIDELPLGARYVVGIDPVPDTSHPDHATCAAACTAANAGQAFDRNALAACVDENWMWFELTGPADKPGFASAKFLDF